jgi:hypothetical protein
MKKQGTENGDQAVSHASSRGLPYYGGGIV